MLNLYDFIREIVQNIFLKNLENMKNAKILQTHTIVFILQKS